MKLSTVLLAKNEERSIERALASIAFSDEIIVIDDDSTDKTSEFAKKAGARVLKKPLKGDFAALRNYGLNEARGDWVLFLDADEELTDELKRSILSVLNNEHKSDNNSAYYLKRRDFFWGRELKFGETKKVREQGLARLVKKDAGVWQGSVHEVFVPSGTTGALVGYLDHYPHPTIKEFLTDINHYSSLRAQELYKAGKRFSLFELIFFPIAKFKYTFFYRLGFLDGPAGFVYAFMMSFHSYLVRAKLYQIEQSK